MPTNSAARATARYWLIPAALTFAALLPLALLSYYNHPFMDDYFNAANAQRLGFWGAQRELYLRWTGRFFSSLLAVGANPMQFGWYDGLRLTPFLILSCTCLIAYLAVRTLSPPGRPRVEAAVLAGSFLLVYLQLIPSLYPTFYWFTGSVVYQLAGMWVLLALAAGVRAGRAASAPARRGWWLTAAFGVVAAGGSNEMALLHVLLGLGLLTLLHWRRPARSSWLGLLAVAGVAAAVSLAAPGNFVRMAEEFAVNPTRRGLLAGLNEAVPQAFFHARSFLKSIPWPLWLGLTAAWALVVLQWRRTAGLPTAPRLPWYLGLPCLIVGLYATELLLQLAMGRQGPDRVINGVWLFWLPAWLTAVWAAVAAAPARRAGPAPAWTTALACTALLLGVYGLGLPQRAWRELLRNGAAYDAQMLAREALLRGDAGGRPPHLVVPPILGITPEHVLISGWDLSADPNLYINTETALYFGLQSLRVDEKLLPQAHPDFRNN
ncbi:hypothetical protein EJV47_19705 [Hymenobacter gummosus]|uniref:Glycosyltransferase RgtA/B/C/D-like domain-containing protein n=1 Tax=Hymenobacter gummosus TaxID=1776032 RepID=A0A3S0J7P8_9BACT|nr:DUF6056 family protein [Hymenobacter gummosus]RTQ47125.1 hypothetical protein EJV47_19705 [Hymenobacter gummosus]